MCALKQEVVGCLAQHLRKAQPRPPSRTKYLTSPSSLRRFCSPSPTDASPINPGSANLLEPLWTIPLSHTTASSSPASFPFFPSARCVSLQLFFTLTLREMPLTDAEIASAALADERLYRLNSFTPEDAVAIGMSIRKRYMTSRRSEAQPGLLITIKTSQDVTLFACSVGMGQIVVGADGWRIVDGMARVARKTSHSTLYIEKGLKAMGRTLETLGIRMPTGYPQVIEGGAFPVWIRTAPCSPVGVIAVYSGSSIEDHKLVTSVLKHYVAKQERYCSPDGQSRTIPTVTTA